MKNLNKKLLLSLLTVVLTFIALGTTTFAWFTLGQTGTVDQIEFQVSETSGIELSADGTNWANKILFSELTLTDNNTTLQPLTSEDGKTFKLVDGSNGTKFMEFNLWVRMTTNSDHTNGDYDKISLSSLTAANPIDTATPGNSYMWSPDIALADYGLLPGQSYEFNPLYATRISFATTTESSSSDGDKVHKVFAIEDGSSATYIVTPTVNTTGDFEANKFYEGPKTGANVGNLKLIKNAADLATARDDAAVVNSETAVYIVALSTSEVKSWGSIPNGNDQIAATADAENGILQGQVIGGLAYDYAHAKNYGSVEGKVPSFPEKLFTPYTSSTTPLLATVNGKGEIKNGSNVAEAIEIIKNIDFEATNSENFKVVKLTVRIWLEGWDADCINAIALEKAKFSFELKGEKSVI